MNLRSLSATPTILVKILEAGILNLVTLAQYIRLWVDPQNIYRVQAATPAQSDRTGGGLDLVTRSVYRTEWSQFGHNSEAQATPFHVYSPTDCQRLRGSTATHYPPRRSKHHFGPLSILREYGIFRCQSVLKFDLPALQSLLQFLFEGCCTCPRWHWFCNGSGRKRASLAPVVIHLVSSGRNKPEAEYKDMIICSPPRLSTRSGKEQRQSPTSISSFKQLGVRQSSGGQILTTQADPVS